MNIYPACMSDPPARGTAIADAHTHNPDAGPGSIINLEHGVYLPPRPDRLYSVGLHPWQTTHCQGPEADAAMERIASAAAFDNVVAIGECGLDALQGAPMAEQERILRMHAAISESMGKPLILHAVRTLQPLIRLRRMLNPTQRWIVHGFRGSAAKAQMLVDAGFDISLGHKYIIGVDKIVPNGRLWHESDMHFGFIDNLQGYRFNNEVQKSSH